VTPFLPSFAQQISDLLRARNPRRLIHENWRRAAVLIPIFQIGSNRFFLLTLRTGKVETHKNQISFPGGVQDPEDLDLVHTALRETWEEIGLAAGEVRVLGEFDEYYSITGLVVTPIAAWIDCPEGLTLNPDEVQEVLQVPWSIFQDNKLVRVELRKRADREIKVYFYRYGRKEIWGLTAQIIRDFLKLIGPLEPQD
jgi:8-oxo-dGTP pyrophosphatase MutT (NUDIX family)